VGGRARPVRPPASGDLEEMEILSLSRDDAARSLAEGDVAIMSCALCLSLALGAGE
jgi:hypothetical protein